jgi:Spy/CpxP family protein refolding chaperone
MKKILFASACVFALSAGGAFAQTQPAPGASSEGNVGPGTTATHHHRTTTHHMRMTHHTKMNNGVTTGSASKSSRSHSMAKPSSEGNVGPGTNNNNTK